MVKLKKYFYVVRPLLACKWILEKACPPPMLFSDLADAALPPDMRPVIDGLLEQKVTTPEMGEGKRGDALNRYIDETLSQLKLEIDALPQDHKASWESLNKLYLNIVDKA